MSPLPEDSKKRVTRSSSSNSSSSNSSFDRLTASNFCSSRKRTHSLLSASDDSDIMPLPLNSSDGPLFEPIPPSSSSSSMIHAAPPIPITYICTSKQKPRHQLIDQHGAPIKKTKLENDACRDLVKAFNGRISPTIIPSADHILATVAHIIPNTELSIYASWLSPEQRHISIQNVMESVEYRQTHRSPHIEHYLRAVDKRREHDLGRNHAAPAVFWMLMTSLLMEHSYPQNFTCDDTSFQEFAKQFPVLITKAREYSRMTNFHVHLHKAHTYLTKLFQLITLNGYLEICLLIVSCLEARGKHHQRSGTNKPFPFRAYRYLIEKTGNKPDIDIELLNEFEVSI